MDAFDNDATQWEDADMDMFGDNQSGNQPDACPTIAGNSTLDRFGCTDSDGDGYSNADISWGYDMEAMHSRTNQHSGRMQTKMDLEIIRTASHLTLVQQYVILQILTDTAVQILMVMDTLTQMLLGHLRTVLMLVSRV